MNKVILIILLFCLLLSFTPLQSQTARPAILYDIRSLGMGGVGVASAKGAYSYIYNPALLTQERFTLSIPGLEAEIGQKFLDLLDFVVDNQENFRKLNKSSMYVSHEEKAEIIKDLRAGGAEFDNIWHRGKISPAIGIVFKNFAFSVYNISQFAGKIDVGIIVPKVEVQAINDLVFSFGYGRQINEKLAMGVGLKLINRNESPIIKLQVEEMSDMNEIIDEGLEDMEEQKKGYGFDIGAIYSLTPKLQVAAMAQDILGDVEDIATPFNFKLGMQYLYNQDLVLAADIEDFFNRDGDKFVNKIYLGGEYRYSVFRMRLGFGQGYPSVGLGLDFRIVKLDYAYFTRELADSPGSRGESYHRVGLGLGW
ncbi:hypothetical protein GF337_07300 [candidate division KSB1 bacterium]|nr:hypothetical protein [candidate division KSB1 bacterium]